jgi:hypothetical protein
LDFFAHIENENTKINVWLRFAKKKDDEEKLVFVLVKIPFEKCLEIAEKIKFKLPIEINDLENNDLESMVESFWFRFESLVPNEIRNNKRRKYFTAPYSANLRKK